MYMPVAAAPTPRSVRSLTVAAIGQMGGPLLAGVIAQPAGLRVGFIAMLPALTIVAAVGLIAYVRGQRPTS